MKHYSLFAAVLALILAVSCGPSKIDKAFDAYVAAFQADSQDVHSMIILKDGKILKEAYFSEGAADKPHVLHSCSKTFTSIAVGFAVSEGLLTVDDKVISFFPDDLPEEISENLAAMTVKDLLTMTCGHDREAPGVRTSEDWVKGFLAFPVEHTPGTYYVYNSLGTFMLSAIVQKLTGEKIVDYLYPRFFEPLGIDYPKWEESPLGINCGGWGLYLKTMDLAKTGQCILQGGMYDGKQVIPAEWVSEMTRRQVDSYPSGCRPEEAEAKGLTPETSQWRLGYGYQMWRCPHNAVRADGANGQYIFVMPEQNAVVAMTAYCPDMQSESDLMWEYIFPALN